MPSGCHRPQPVSILVFSQSTSTVCSNRSLGLDSGPVTPTGPPDLTQQSAPRSYESDSVYSQDISGKRYSLPVAVQEPQKRRSGSTRGSDSGREDVKEHPSNKTLEGGREKHPYEPGLVIGKLALAKSSAYRTKN